MHGRTYKKYPRTWRFSPERKKYFSWIIASLNRKRVEMDTQVSSDGKV